MSSLIVHVLTDLVQLWPWWLSSMLKVTVWLGVWALVDGAMRRRSASLRHVVATLAALGLPLIFLFNLSPRPEARGWQPLTPLWERVVEGGPSSKATALPAAKAGAESPAPPLKNPASSRPFWPGLVIVIWGAGVCLMWMRLVVRSWPRPRAGRQADHDSEATLLQALERECRDLGIAQLPSLWMVPDAVPRLTGVGRPVIEMPAAARDWPGEKLSAVLRHELAHVRRSDLRWLVATEAALALVWGHPLGLLLRRRLVRSREEACDDRVLASGVDPATYAAHLASFLTVSAPSHRWALPAVERVDWVPRFRRLLDPRASRRSVRWWELAGISLAAGALAVGGTLSVGCAGPRPVAPIKTSHEESPPETIAGVSSQARTLNIQLRVFDLIAREQEAEALGFPKGFPRAGGPVLSPEAGRKLFDPQRRGLDLMAAPIITARPGQQAKLEVTQPIKYPLQYQPNPQTGLMEGVVFEVTNVGTLLTVTARPTSDPGIIRLQYEFELKEFEGFKTDKNLPKELLQPVFYTRRISDEVEVPNGSYFILGFKPNTQTVEDAVPLLSDLPIVGRLFRTVDRSYGQLAAVQVIVEEADK